MGEDSVFANYSLGNLLGERWTEHLESSELYLTWGAYALLGANVGRRVFLKTGFREVYPNLYIVIVGPSGWGRKGTAFTPVHSLVRLMGTALCPEKISGAERMVWRMREKAGEDFECRERGHIRQSNMACFSEELIVFLRTPPHNRDLLAVLTDWYDAPAHLWTYETFKHDEIEIRNPIFSLYGASSPEHLQEILPGKFMQGGFASRTIFVWSSGKRKSTPEEPPPNKSLEGSLLAGLADMRKMVGQIKPSKAAQSWYKAWYLEEDQRNSRGEWAVMDHHFRDYCGRRPTHLRKLAILNAVAKARLSIEVTDFEEALDLLLRTEQHMPQVFQGKGSAPHAELMFKVREWIQGKGPCARSEVMRAFPNDLDQQIMDRIEQTLYESGFMQVTVSGRGKKYDPHAY